MKNLKIILIFIFCSSWTFSVSAQGPDVDVTAVSAIPNPGTVGQTTTIFTQIINASSDDYDQNFNGPVQLQFSAAAVMDFTNATIGGPDAAQLTNLTCTSVFCVADFANTIIPGLSSFDIRLENVDVTAVTAAPETFAIELIFPFGSTDPDPSNFLNSDFESVAASIFIQDESGPWDIPANWIDGVVPTVNDNAIIDAGVESYLTQDQAVNNLELRPGSTVSIPNGSTLNIKGNIINNGDFTLYDTTFPSGTVGNPNVDGEVLLDGPTLQQLSGAGNYYNLRVDNTNGVDVLNADTTDPTEINGALFVDLGEFTTNNNVLFPCDFDSPTGPSPFTRHAVGQIGRVDGSISGSVTVEQCFPGRRAFRLVSASTSGESMHNAWQENPDIAQGGYQHNPRPGYGTHITGLAPGAPNALLLKGDDQLNGLDWQPSGNVSVFGFDETNQANPWVNVIDTETTILGAGDPYLMMIRGSRAVDLELNTSPTSNTKLESTGTPATGAVPVTPSITTSLTNDQFALIGNPYHAVVDLNQVIPGSGYTNFVTFYDPNLGGNANINATGQLGGRGGYVTVDATTGTPAVITGLEVNATDASNQLQPYQAFFVRVESTVPPGTINFQESSKNVTATQTDVFDSSEQPRIFVSLFDKESLENLNTPDDGLVIYFSPESSNAIDANDAPKFFNQDEVIARNESGSLVSFENRAMPVEDDVLQIYTDQYRTTDYVLEVGVQFLPEHTVYLIDNYTTTEVALENNASNTYSFRVDPSSPLSAATDRFELRFKNTTLGTNDFDLQGISVYPVPATDLLTINFGENIGRFDSVELFDISGRLVAKQTIGSQLQETKLDVNTFSSGVYLLKVSSDNEQITTKVLIE